MGSLARVEMIIGVVRRAWLAVRGLPLVDLAVDHVQQVLQDVLPDLRYDIFISVVSGMFDLGRRV